VAAASAILDMVVGQVYNVPDIETVRIDIDRVFRKTTRMKRDMTSALRHKRGRSIALMIAVKVAIVVLVLTLPAWLALSLGAAHGIAMVLVVIGAGVVLVVRHLRGRSHK
jgi:hypothetical protein